MDDSKIIKLVGSPCGTNILKRKLSHRSLSAKIMVEGLLGEKNCVTDIIHTTWGGKG
jgi:hypothetical protein